MCTLGNVYTAEVNLMINCRDVKDLHVCGRDYGTYESVLLLYFYVFTVKHK